MLSIKEMAGRLPPLSSIHASVKRRQREDGTRYAIRYLDIPICFDSETFSFKVKGEDGELEKRAVMWAWGLAIGEECYLGRTWGEFLDALDSLVEAWGITPEHRAVIWVHNLSYDFQWFRGWLEWDTIFALSPREVCYALEKRGLEFRCSYILTGYALEKVGEHLMHHDLKKLVGTIDYDIPRHPGTRLTDTEVAYLEADCLVVTAHIAEQIEKEGGISNIPLTKTGYVRRDVRLACFRDPKLRAGDDRTRLRYGSFIKGMTLDDFVYDSLRRAFQGGYTHASPYHSGEVMEDVTSYDFASAYPAVMCSEYFPATPPQVWDVGRDKGEFRRCLDNYLCVFTVTLRNVRPRINYDHYLSESHCDIPKGSQRQIDNGRIVWADELTTTITNVDWEIIIRCYTFDPPTVSGMIRWGKGYLPKPIVQCCIRYFQAKTELKGKRGSEEEYMSAKENLNSIYGMMVMDPLRPQIPYDMERGQWGKVEDGRVLLALRLSGDEKEKALEGYNDDRQRFTYYAWGVFITAYCRKNLWRGILHFKEDYCYADTDSVKVMHGRDASHLAHIQKHNENIQAKIRKCLRYHGMDEALSAATTPKGDVKELGVWEHDGDYVRFKSLGAKRYMTESVNQKTGGKVISITVSGVNKRVAVPYILSRCAGPKRVGEAGGGDPFDFFSMGLEIPPGYAGKMIPFYGDHEIVGQVRDRDGVVYDYHEMSYVHMEPGGYSMSAASEYVRYLHMLQKGLI